MNSKKPTMFLKSSWNLGEELQGSSYIPQLVMDSLLALKEPLVALNKSSVVYKNFLASTKL
jgi:hypothetical protein